MQLNKIDTQGKVKLYTIDNFLSDEECNYVITKIEEKSERSKISGNQRGWDVSDYRTSSTANLPIDDDIIKRIDDKIHEATGSPKELGELIQGQKYEVGQEFKMHTDYFDKGAPDYDIHVNDKGQRIMTFMIYLNDVEHGGETFFHNLGIKFKPKKGQAVVWHNIDENGVENYNTLHSGLPVIQGTKYIITKWFRAGKEQQTTTQNTQQNMNTWKSSMKRENNQQQNTNVVDYRSQINQINEKPEVKSVTSLEDFPRFTEMGFEVKQIPEHLWKKLQEIYRMLEHTELPEDNLGGFIMSDKNHAASMMNMDNIPTIKNDLHEEFRSIHEEWCGEELELATFYGIRSYLDGAQLVMHTDRPEELHISSILHIDEDVNEPWPLHIQGRDGETYQIITEPGQMIFYESAVYPHGRPDTMNGRFFRNAFIHYKLKNYQIEI